MEGSTTTEVRFRDLRTPAEIEALAPDWDALVASARRPSPYLLASWVADWLREFGDAVRALHHGRDARRALVGIAPVRRAPERGFAHFVGGHESSLADCCWRRASRSPLPGSLLEPLAGSGACAAQRLRGSRDSVLIRAAGRRLRSIPRVGAPVLEMPDGWEAAYERRMSKDRRRNDRRVERRLNDLGSLEVDVARDPAGVAERSTAPSSFTARAGRAGPTGRRSACPSTRASCARRSPSLAGQGRYGICLCASTAAASPSRPGFGSARRCTAIARRSIPSSAATEPGRSRSGTASPRPPRPASSASSSWATTTSTSAASPTGSTRCTSASGSPEGLGGRLQVARVVAAIEARKRLKKYDRIHRCIAPARCSGRGERAA